MVEENFKVGIELEIDQESLTTITKQVEAAVLQAHANATAGAARGGGPGGAAKSAVTGGAATAKSIANAIGVTQEDFKQVVKEFSRENQISADKFEKAAEAIVRSLERLTKTIESKRGGTPGATGASPVSVKPSVGGTNDNLAADAKVRAAVSRKIATATPVVTETITPSKVPPKTGLPKVDQDAKKEALRSPDRPVHKQVQFAEARAKEVADSLDGLLKTISSVGALGKIKDLSTKINLPTGADVKVGPGATAEIKMLSGQTKTVTGYVRMFGTEIKEVTNIVSKRVSDLERSDKFKADLKIAARYASKPGGEEAAIGKINQIIKGLFKLPILHQGGAAAYQKGGETQLEVEFSGAQRKKYKLLKDDASLLAAFNKDLWEMNAVLTELGKRAGIETLGSVGLSEETAAAVQVDRTTDRKRIPTKIIMDVETRELADLTLGGKGGQRWARSFQPMQARPLVNGEDPRVMGKGEANAYETGMFQRGSSRNMKTAYLNPQQVPEVYEDMILVDEKAAKKLDMWEPKITSSMAATTLKAGDTLTQDQVIGTDVQGNEIKFDLSGAEAKIESIEKVVEDGVEGVRIKYQELYKFITGSKLTTFGGFKAVAMVVKDLDKKYGLPEGTEVAMSGHGAAKRGILGDVMKMMATSIADKAQVEAQGVADVIEEAMRNGGKDIVEAVSAAADVFGVKGFTGRETGSKLSALTGEQSWMRIKEPKAPGEGLTGPMHFDLAAMRGLQQRAGTDKMANDMQARMRSFSSKQTELFASLRTLAGDSSVAAEGLRELLPEEFKQLPALSGKVEQFVGTLLDPKFKEALAIRMPTRDVDMSAVPDELRAKQQEQRDIIRELKRQKEEAGHGNLPVTTSEFGEKYMSGSRMGEVVDVGAMYSGMDVVEALKEAKAEAKALNAEAEKLYKITQGEELFRMPAQGKMLGMRGQHDKKGMGTMGPDEVSRKIDQIVQQGRHIRMAEGRLTPDIGEISPEDLRFKDIAQPVSRSIRDQIDAFTKMNLKLDENAAAADKFVESLLPVLDTLKLSESIAYYNLNAAGERATKRPRIAGKVTDSDTGKVDYLGKKGNIAGEYVRQGPDTKQRLLRLQDVVTGRAPTATSKTENVGTSGEIFKNAQLLESVMSVLGVTLTKDYTAVEKLYRKLDDLKEEFVSMLSIGSTMGTADTKDPRKFTYASQVGSGLANTHRELTAVQFRTDVTKELDMVDEVLSNLNILAPGVVEGLSALERMKDAQGGAEVNKIPRDAVFINKKDWDTLVDLTKKEQGIDKEGAESRLSRTGLLNRYPITGPASFLPTNLQVDPTGAIPEGKIGVAGAMAVSSLEDLALMKAPLEGVVKELYADIDAVKGQGEAADAARAQLEVLVPLLAKLNQQYLAAGLNLDFDGDKIRWLADTATKAGSGLQTFASVVDKGGVSLKQMMLNYVGGVAGGSTEDISQYAELFGKTAKLREGDARRAILNPATGQLAEAETRAHTGGKMSVGLLTDEYNKTLLAITEGTKKTGDAWATGIDFIMLNINKSLAQKSGGGGLAGPMEFTKDLRAGNLSKMFEGMDSDASGIYKEMGDFNRSMRDQMTESFQSVYRRKGSQGLKDLAKEKGVEDLMPQGDITYEKFVGVVDKMVDALDLKSVIRRMFSQMEENMKIALKNEGMSPSAIGYQMSKYMEPNEKGNVPGLDVDRMLQSRSPETKAYMLTRKRSVDAAMSDMTPMEAALSAIEILPRKMAENIIALADGFQLEEAVNPQEQAGLIRKSYLEWIHSIAGTFRAMPTQKDFEKLGISPQSAQGARGAYIGARAATDTEPARKEEIFISSQLRLNPAAEALEVLKSISEGATVSADQLQKLSEALHALPVTYAHESVHKASKQFPEILKELVRGINDSTSDLGKAKGTFVSVMSQYSGVRDLAVKYSTKYTRAQNDPNLEKPTDDPEVRAYANALFSVIGEELLARQTDPEFLGQLRKAGVSDEAINALTHLFDKLREKAPDAISKALEIGSRVGSDVLDSLIQGVQNEAARGAPGPAGDEWLKGSFPGSDKITAASSKLRSQESLILASSADLGLNRVERKGQNLSVEEDFKTGVEGHIPDVSKRITDIINAIREALPSDDDLLTMDRDIRQEGMLLEAGMKDIKGANGRKAVIKTMQEFHNAVAVAFINKAREIERTLAEMRKSGQAELDPGLFANKIAELEDVLTRFSTYEQRTLFGSGKGRSTIMSNIADTAGDAGSGRDFWEGAGVTPGPEMLTEQINRIAGRGAKGDAFLQQMGPSIEQAITALKTGEGHLEAWDAIMTAIREKPEQIHTNLGKMSEILAKISRHLSFVDEQFGDGAASAMEMAKSAKQIKAALDNIDVKTDDDFLMALANAPKAARLAATPVRGEGIVASVEQQYKDAEQVAKAWQKKLELLIQTPGYKAAGSPRNFEPIMRDIVDPDSKHVFQKLAIEAKRAGNSVQVSMKQVGVASHSAGTQLRNAFKRVVQWGFASGLVYGVVRAFRSMVSIVVEVETKMTALKKVMDTSITDFKGMQDAAIGFAKEFGISIGDVLDGMVVYGQQGLEMGEILNRTRATMLAVNVTTLSSKEATEALTAAHKVFGTEVEGSIGFVDAWGAVAAKHAITAKDLAMAVQRSGAAARTAGVGFNDFLGMVTAIGAVTRQSGKEIATSMKFIFRAMRRPTAIKSLLGAGIKTADVTGQMRPAVDVLTDVAGAWGDMSRAQQLSTAQAMAGIRHYNQFIVLMENWQEALVASKDAQNSQGFAARKGALAVQTFAKQMEVFKQTVNDVALSLGKALLPATTLVIKGAIAMVGAFNALPDVLTRTLVLAVGAVAGISKLGQGMLAVGDMIFGDKFGKSLGSGTGLVNIGKTVGSKLWSGIKSVPSGVTNLLEAGASGIANYGFNKKFESMTPKFDKKGKFGQQDMMKFMNLKQSTEGMGVFQKAAIGAGQAIQGLWATMHLGKAALVGSGIGIAVLVLSALTVTWMKAHKSAKEFEDEMFDVIGKSQDVTTALGSQATKVGLLSQAWKKYEKAKEVSSDPVKLAEAFDAGTYTGPLQALKEYGDLLRNTGTAMAKLNPSQIAGISESGDYLLNVGKGYDQIAASASDASKATTAALQTKVIEAYAKELTEAKGPLDTFLETIVKFGTLGFGDIDLSIISKIKKVRGTINQLTAAKKESASRGISPEASQKTLTELVNKELGLREEMVLSAMNLKRVLDEMPTFENLELGKLAMGGKVRKSIEAAIPTGVFGSEATAGSVIMSKLAKTAGLGGVLGAEATAAPNRLRQNLLEQGIQGTRQDQLAAKNPGSLAILDPKAASAVLALYNGSKKLAEVTPEVKSAIENARTMIVTVDAASGEMLYTFEDALSGMSTTIRESDLNNILRKAMAGAVTIDQAKIEEAAMHTRKLLTLTFVGAMAGIRIPEGGMPDLGKALKTEMSVPERVLGTLPDEMERLGEIQREMTEITKRYNESIGEGADISEDAAAGISENYRVLAKAQQDMVMALQLEAFDLSFLGQIESSFQKLQKTLEDTARASRDASIEEETRLQLLKHTSGAMAGLPVVSELNFGKSMRELSAQERLQKEMGPGFASSMAGINSKQRQYESNITKTTDIRKQLADFGEMLSDMDTARTVLDQEQASRKAAAELKGIKTDSEEIARRSEDASALIETAIYSQTPLLDRMVTALDAMVNMSGMTTKEKKDFAQRKIGEMRNEDLVSAMGKTDPNILPEFISTITGLRAMTEDELNNRTFWQANRGTTFTSGTGGTTQLSAASQEKYDEAASDWIDAMSSLTAYNKRYAASESGKPVYERGKKGLEDKVSKAQNKILGLGEYDKPIKDKVRSLANDFAAERQKKKKLEAEQRDADLRTQIAEARSRVMGELTAAEGRAVAETQQTAKLLAVAEGFRMAAAAQGVVQGMEGLIDEFKKTEMLFYEKKDSDLEGAFARVGQPGFKTTFEQRQDVLDEASNKPVTMDQLRQRKADQEQLDFDIKEAKIKQKQDIETNALKTQQGEAEKIRDFLATKLTEGGLDSGAANMTKQYLQTLTDQLSESEQATMRGDELTFKGIPALDQARDFLAKMQEHAKKQAQAAELEFQRKAQQPVVDSVQQVVTGVATTNSILQQQTALMARSANAAGAAGVAATGIAALPPSAVMGIPATGAVRGGPGARPRAPGPGVAAAGAAGAFSLAVGGMPGGGPGGTGPLPVSAATLATGVGMGAAARSHGDAVELAEGVRETGHLAKAPKHAKTIMNATKAAAARRAELIARGKTNVNTASLEDLQKVSGIGKNIASGIIEGRQGPAGDFRSLDELSTVKGISTKKLAQIREKLSVKGPASPSALGGAVIPETVPFPDAARTPGSVQSAIDKSIARNAKGHPHVPRASGAARRAGLSAGSSPRLTSGTALDLETPPSQLMKARLAAHAGEMPSPAGNGQGVLAKLADKLVKPEVATKLEKWGSRMSMVAAAISGGSMGYAGQMAANAPEGSAEQQRAGAAFVGEGGALAGGLAGATTGGAIGTALGGALGSIIPGIGNAVGAAVGGVLGTIGGGIGGAVAGHFGASSLSGLIDEKTGGAYSSQLGDIFRGQGADAITPALFGDKSIGNRMGDAVLNAEPDSFMAKAGRFAADIPIDKFFSFLTGLGKVAEQVPAIVPTATIASVAGTNAPVPSDADAYAALGMPDQGVGPLTGSKDYWLQKIASMQTTAEPAAMNPDIMRGLPTVFTAAAEEARKPMTMIKGQARTDYSGDAGMFPQAQTFQAPGEPAVKAGEYKPFEGTKSTIDDIGAIKAILLERAAGTREFEPSAPGSFASNLAKSPGGAQAYIEELQRQRKQTIAGSPEAQGNSPSNYRRAVENQVQSDFGNAGLGVSGVPIDPKNPAPQGTAAAAALADQRPVPSATSTSAETTEALASAVADLSTKFASLLTAISSLGELGNKIDGTTAAVTSLGTDGMPVTLTGDSAVTVSNLADIDLSGLDQVGAAVTTGAARLLALETLVGDEDVETQIASRVATAETELTGILNTALTEGQEASILAAQAAAEEAAKAEVLDIQTQIEELSVLKDTLEKSEEANATLLQTVNDALDAATEDLEDAIEKAQEAADAAKEAEDNIEELTEAIETATAVSQEAKDTADAAKGEVDTATLAAKTATEAVAGLGESLKQEATTRATEDIKLADRIQTAKDGSVTKDELNKVKGVAERADRNASTALNKPGRP